MVDLVAGIITLLNWFLWIALASSVGLLAIALVKKARGDSDADRYLICGLIVVIIGTSGWNLIKILTSGLTFPFQPQYDWVGYAIIGAFFVGSMLYYAVGRKEEGTGMLVACVGTIVVLGLVPQLLSVMGVALNGLQFGAFPVQAYADPSFGYPPLNVTLTVQIMDYNPNITSWNVLVDWGDGTNTSYTTTVTTFSLYHVYTTANNYGISVTVREIGGNGTGLTYTAVAVQPPPSLNVFVYPLQQFLDPIFKIFSSFLSVPFAFIYMSPVFDTNSNSWMMQIYDSILTVSIAGLGIFWALRLIHGALASNSFEKEVVDSLKEMIAIVAVIASAPYLYNIAVDILNNIANSLVSQINFAPLYAVIAGVILLGILVGPLDVYMSDISAFISSMFALATAVCLLRYWLIVALILCAPLLCVFYIHPAFRGAVKVYTGFLALLMLAGPVASVLLASLSLWLNSVPFVGAIIYAVSLPIIVAVLPFTILIATSGNFMLGSLGVFRGVSAGIPAFVRAGGATGRLVGDSLSNIFRSNSDLSEAHTTTEVSQIEPVTPLSLQADTTPLTVAQEDSKAGSLLGKVAESMMLPHIHVKFEKTKERTKVSAGIDEGGIGGEVGIEHREEQTKEEVGAPVEPPENYISKLEEMVLNSQTEQLISQGTTGIDKTPITNQSRISVLKNRISNFTKLTIQHLPKHYHGATGHVHPEVFPWYKKSNLEAEDSNLYSLAQEVKMAQEGFDIEA